MSSSSCSWAILVGRKGHWVEDTTEEVLEGILGLVKLDIEGNRSTPSIHI